MKSKLNCWGLQELMQPSLLAPTFDPNAALGFCWTEDPKPLDGNYVKGFSVKRICQVCSRLSTE
jgi:hypothetical protein